MIRAGVIFCAVCALAGVAAAVVIAGFFAAALRAIQ